MNKLNPQIPFVQRTECGYERKKQVVKQVKGINHMLTDRS